MGTYSRKDSMNILLTTISSITLYLAVFMLPFAFFSFSTLGFSLKGEYILFSVILVAFLSRFSKMVLEEKEIRFRKTYLDLSIFLFVLFGIISSFASQDSRFSLFGVQDSLSAGILALVAGAMFYFLLSQKTKVPLKNMIQMFSLGCAVSLIFAFFSWFVPNFPLKLSESFLVLIAFFALLTAGSLSTGRAGIVGLVSLAGSLVFLAMSGLYFPWLILASGLILLLFLILLQRMMLGEVLPLRKTLLAGFALLVSVVFLFSPSWIKPRVIEEKRLSNQVSFNIAVRSIKSGVKETFLGSGPATFSIDASRYGSWMQQELGQSRTVRVGNSFAELLAEQGALGFLLYIGILLLFFFSLLLLSISKKELEEASKNQQDRSAILPAGALFGGYIASLFVLPQDFLLSLIFWFALGIGSFGIRAEEVFLTLKKSLFIALGARAIFVGCFIFAFFFFKYGVMVVRASQEFQKGNLEKASLLDEQNPEYKKLLALRHRSEIEKESKLQEPNKAKITMDVQRSFEFGKQAVELGPWRVDIHEALALVYRDVSFVQGAAGFAIQSFGEAIRLEPMNPVLYNEVAKLKLAKDDLFGAKESVEQSLKLKNDLNEALITKALILEKEGETESAISILKKVLERSPPNEDTLFQLGRLQANGGNTEEAVALFRKVLQINPSNSNAHFALGSVLEKQGNKEGALQEFQKVLALNPSNQEVAKKIEQLHNKK